MIDSIATSIFFMGYILIYGSIICSILGIFYFSFIIPKLNFDAMMEIAPYYYKKRMDKKYGNKRHC